MKIVYVLESLEMSGGVKVIIEHAEGLASRGHEVSIVTRDSRHSWIPVGVPVTEVLQFDESTIPPADVHVATWFPTVVPTVRARLAPKVFHFSQGWEAIYPNTAHRMDEIDEAYRQPVPKLLISAHLQAIFEGRYPGPFHVLPQVIPAADFAPPDPARAGTRHPPTIGVVGPFEAPLKGIAVALRAMAKLREGGRDVLLHRASALPLTEEERVLLAADAYSHALPAAAMPAWYHGLDLLLFASTDGEGFGLPPLEAMAAGVPVVISDIPSLSVLPTDAVSRVPVGDSAAMAREAAHLLDDPTLWARRRTRGLEVARTFTIDAVLDRLEEIFSQKTS
ncbi:MAG TPA: glycosyltransferase family 4 protein [Thermoanaerobaculia bacterium]